MATDGISDIEKGSEEFFDFLCTECNKKNKYTEAEKFCSDCHTYYCDGCVELHDYIPTLKGHKIIYKAQFSLVTSQPFPVVPTEQRGRKPVDMYCKQHDTVGCATCMVVEHQACKNIVYVPEFITTNASADSYKYISTKLSSIATTLKGIEANFTKNKQMLENSKGKAVKQIQDQIEEYLRDLQALASEKSTLDNLQSASGNQSQLFVNIKKASAFAFKATETINTLITALSNPEISFSENPKLKSLLQEAGHLRSDNFQYQRPTSSNLHVPQILNITTSSKPHSHRPKQTVKVIDSHSSNQHTSSLLKIKGKKTYSVQVKSDTAICCMYGACTLEDGTVILSDRDNRKLKRLDSSTYTVRDCCDVPTYPWQMCVISQQEVAVVCGVYSKVIQFVSVGCTMQTTRQIHTDHPCYGLAYADDKLFVAGRTSVYVYTMTGDRLQQFSKDQSGQSLFSNIYSLVVSRDNTKIYVADRDKGLIILDRNGKLVRQFNGPELSAAVYVCLYKDDGILICEERSKNVLKFTTDGELVGGVLKTHKVCRCVCWNNSKLIVGYVRSNNIDCYDTCSKVRRRCPWPIG